ncbi:MAG: PEGA domain-containing protein [Planctomycetota bacterium]|nr:PEGA domain-containing protein [Planctomycetota bacterium]
MSMARRLVDVRTRARPRARAVACVLAVCAAGGCMRRTIVVTSDPPGATVVLSDVEVGRTPVEAEFLYYGTYDVLLTKDGFEPLRTAARASPPVYDIPPLDLPASAVPGARSTIRWHFTLEPALESRLPKAELEAGVLDRARALRSAEPAPRTP